MESTGSFSAKVAKQRKEEEDAQAEQRDKHSTCYSTLIQLLKKEFEGVYEVQPIFSIYGPLKWIYLIKAGEYKVSRNLMATKTTDGQDRYHALTIRWRNHNCAYEKAVIVETYKPVFEKETSMEFPWDNEFNWEQYGFPMSIKTITEDTMNKIIKHIKTL